MQPITIHLADPSPYGRAGLEHLLGARPAFTLANSAPTIAALDLSAGGVLIAHLHALGPAPLPALEALRKHAARLAIVVIADSADFAPDLVANGARGVVVRHDPIPCITEAIRVVARGQRFLSPAAQAQCDRHAVLVKVHHLSASAAITLQLLVTGLAPETIACYRNLAPRTIDNHLCAIRERTGCSEQVEIVAWYRARFGVQDGQPAVRATRRDAPRRMVAPAGLPRLGGSSAQLVQWLAVKLPISAMAEARGCEQRQIRRALLDLRHVVGCRDDAALEAWCRRYAPAYADPEAAPVLVYLTPLEQQLVQLHASGQTSSAVAKLRNVTPSTVRKAMSKIRTRLGCASNADLFAWYAAHYPDAVLELPTRDAVLELASPDVLPAQAPDDLILELPARDEILVLPARDALLDLAVPEAVPIAPMPPAAARAERPARHDHIFCWLEAASLPIYHRIRSDGQGQRRPRAHASPTVAGRSSPAHPRPACAAPHNDPPLGCHAVIRMPARSLGNPASATLSARASPTLAQARAAPWLTHGIAPPLPTERWGGSLCVR